jgi:hypothetical protein
MRGKEIILTRWVRVKVAERLSHPASSLTRYTVTAPSIAGDASHNLPLAPRCGIDAAESGHPNALSGGCMVPRTGCFIALLLCVSSCTIHMIHAPPASTPADTVFACQSSHTNCTADCLELIQWWPGRRERCLSNCNLAWDHCIGYDTASASERESGPRPAQVIKIRPTTIAVPDTPDAQACWRQCTQITASCIPGCSAQGPGAVAAVQQCMDSCANTRDKCLRTCPGAKDTGAPVSSNWDDSPRRLPSPAECLEHARRSSAH